MDIMHKITQAYVSSDMDAEFDLREEFAAILRDDEQATDGMSYTDDIISEAFKYGMPLGYWVQSLFVEEALSRIDENKDGTIKGIFVIPFIMEEPNWPYLHYGLNETTYDKLQHYVEANLLEDGCEAVVLPYLVSHRYLSMESPVALSRWTSSIFDNTEKTTPIPMDTYNEHCYIWYAVVGLSAKLVDVEHMEHINRSLEESEITEFRKILAADGIKCGESNLEVFEMFDEIYPEMDFLHRKTSFLSYMAKYQPKHLLYKPYLNSAKEVVGFMVDMDNRLTYLWSVLKGETPKQCRQELGREITHLITGEAIPSTLH